MSDTVEKIYCTDNNDALLASVMGKTQTCEILRDNQRNTQHIIDTLNTHWNQDLQQKYNDARLELSQVRQNQYLISQLKPTTTTTA